MASIIPATTSQVVSRRQPTRLDQSTSRATGVDKDTLAGNFQTFLTLLTTQLKNQNPLDPLDTNQFTRSSCSSPRSSSSSSRTTSSPRWSRCRRPRSRPRRSNSSARPSRSTARPRRFRTAPRPGLSRCPSPRPPPSTSRARPARPSTPATTTMNAGTAALRLGRQGCQRPAMARRQLHDRDHRARTPTASRSRSRPRSRRTVDSADLTQNSAAAFDRRPGLHARQDQARGPQFELTAR